MATWPALTKTLSSPSKHAALAWPIFALGPVRTKHPAPTNNIGLNLPGEPLMKATKPRIRTKAKRMTQSIKDKAHTPVIAGRPINRSKARMPRS